MERIIRNHTAYIRSKKAGKETSKNVVPYKENRKRIAKAYAFKSLNTALLHQFRADHITHLPRLEIRFIKPGDLYQREMQQLPRGENNSTEEILRQIWVQLYCREEQDCYQVLHAIHRLGKPVAPRFSEHFDDNIAVGQSNGYRALKTSIIYSYSKPSVEGGQFVNVLVEFRIMTERMRKLNAEGVIQAFYKKRGGYDQDDNYSSAWWHPKKIEQLYKQLSNKYKQTKYDSIGSFLSHYDLGTIPEDVITPLYIFTPMGDIVLMEQGCMPLDFAYQIHSDLGNHAAKVKVNGQATSYNFILQNGDMVEITYDRQFSGPDISWLGLVETARARQIIRKRLAIQFGYQSPGRAKIQEELERAIVKYRNLKHYDLRITTSKLDFFLEEYADLRALPNLEALYDSVRQKNENPRTAGAIHPHNIIERLISNELAASLTGIDGKPLEYSAHRISFCEVCRPVPGDALVAYEHGRNERRNIIIHTKESLCKRGEREIQIRWAEEPVIAPVAEFQIVAEDRDYLLVDILKSIRNHPGFTLLRVEAYTKQDGSAMISLLVSSANFRSFDEIRHEIELTKGLRQIWLAPVSKHELFKLAANGESYNPYKQIDVYRRNEFYDREKQVTEILRWLQDKSANYWLILHGQKRIGKTSFVEHMSYTVLPENGLAFPAFVDLLNLENGTLESLACQILNALYTEIRIKMPAKPILVPQRHEGESTVDWLLRGLEEAQKLRNGQPLFIILDELDYLIVKDNFIANPEIFRNLIYVMKHSPFIRWLLVISDTVFQNPQVWGDAKDIFYKSDSILLSTLEKNYAMRMIREPAELNGFSFPDSDKRDKFTHPCSIVTRIYDEAGGHPYYVKRICFHLIDWLRRQQKNNISGDDLDYALRDVLLHGHIYFDHFIRALSAVHMYVLVAAATLTIKHGNTSSESVIIECQRLKPQVNKNEVELALIDLEREGGIQIMEDHRVIFPVKIFASYVNETLYKRVKGLHLVA
jgi:hypothetical protein